MVLSIKSRIFAPHGVLMCLSGYDGQEEDNLYYYHKGIEMDFYVPREGLGIQVSYGIRDYDTRGRET